MRAIIIARTRLSGFLVAARSCRARGIAWLTAPVTPYAAMKHQAAAVDDLAHPEQNALAITIVTADGPAFVPRAVTWWQAPQCAAVEPEEVRLSPPRCRSQDLPPTD